MRYQIRLARNTWRGVVESGRGKVDMSRWPAVLSPDLFSHPEIYPDSETSESVCASGSGRIEVFPESDVLLGGHSKASSSVQMVSSSFIDLIIFSDDWIEDISISAMSSLGVPTLIRNFFKSESSWYDIFRIFQLPANDVQTTKTNKILKMNQNQIIISPVVDFCDCWPSFTPKSSRVY